MIRDATHDDIPQITKLGELFHVESGCGDIFEYSRDDTAKTLENLITGEDGILLVAERDGEIIGMCGGIAYPLYCNFAHKTGQELFWWMRPDLRDGTGRLLFDALESRARALGCHSWTMFALDTVKPELTGRIYRRRGYRPSEHNYMKRL